MARKNDDFCCLICSNKHISVTLRIFVKPNRPREQMSCCLSFGQELIHICQWPSSGMEGLPHQVNTIRCGWVAASVTNGSLHRFKCLEDSLMVMPTREE